MPLQSGVDGEATSGRVHGCHILHIVHLLESLLLSVVPVVVVQMLSDQCVGLHCAICVHLWHVHIINEVDEFLCAWRPEVPASLLLKGLLHHLQHRSIKVT